MNFHRHLSAEMLLSEPRPAAKGRTEMSVSVAWATVKREGHERGKRSRSEIPPVCLGLCPQLCSDDPLRCQTPATITHISDFY